MSEYVWGRNPVLETLHSARHVKRILLAEGQREAPALASILKEAERRQIPVEVVPRPRLDSIAAAGTEAVFRWCSSTALGNGRFVFFESAIEVSPQRVPVRPVLFERFRAWRRVTEFFLLGR